jgi:phenylpropionate dioxygenase-like ring-hydroxylating dioxygenase large terminal subunit
MIDCNWLQSLEVGIDPAHTSFLHRFFHDEDPSQGYGKLFRDTSIDSDMPMTQIMREFPRPRIEVENTDYGLRLITLRTAARQSSAKPRKSTAASTPSPAEPSAGKSARNWSSESNGGSGTPRPST